MAKLFDLKQNPDIDAGQYTPLFVADNLIITATNHIGLPWYWNRVKNIVEVYGYAYIQTSSEVEPPTGWQTWISLPDVNFSGNIATALDLVGTATPEHATKSFIIFGSGSDFGNGFEQGAFINASDAGWNANYGEAVEVFFSYRLS